jgi:hypothetical protein
MLEPVVFVIVIEGGEESVSIKEGERGEDVHNNTTRHKSKKPKNQEGGRDSG